MNINQRLAKNIKLLRKSIGLTQEELADGAGLHRTYIGRIEQGKGNPGTNAIQKISNALRISPAFLFFEIDSYDQASSITSPGPLSKIHEDPTLIGTSRANAAVFIVERNDQELIWAPLLPQNKDELLSILFYLLAADSHAVTPLISTSPQPISAAAKRYTSVSLDGYLHPKDTHSQHPSSCKQRIKHA